MWHTACGAIFRISGTWVKPVGDNRPVPERGAQIGCPADFVILLSSQDQHGDHQVGNDFFDKIDAKLGQQNPPVSPVTQHRKSDRLSTNCKT